LQPFWKIELDENDMFCAAYAPPTLRHQKILEIEKTSGAKLKMDLKCNGKCKMKVLMSSYKVEALLKKAYGTDYVHIVRGKRKDAMSELGATVRQEVQVDGAVCLVSSVQKRANSWIPHSNFRSRRIDKTGRAHWDAVTNWSRIVNHTTNE